MSVNNSSLDTTLQHLREVRMGLLRLHKALLESERASYEQFYGPIKSKGEYFQLVVGHEWFNWLHNFSEFIVQIDEFLDVKAKEPVTLDRANQLLAEARTLIQPSEEGTTLQIRYYQAIQRDVDVAFMHTQVSNLVNSH